MKNFKNLLALSIIVFLIQSCTKAYHPSSVNTGLFEKQNETKVSLSGITDLNTYYKGNFEFAHSITDNVLITGGAFAFESGEEDNTKCTEGSTSYGLFGNTHASCTTTYKNEGYSFTIAPGYYKKISENYIFETLIGYGFNYSKSGEIIRTVTTYSSNATKGSYHKFYIQPTIGFVNSKIESSFTPRLTTVYFNTNTFLIPSQSETRLYFEPTYTFKVGKKLKFVSQIMLSIPLQKPFTEHQPIDFSIGLSYHFRNNKS